MIFDYETLKVVWWLLIGVLLIGFAVTDGFDMGIGILLPFLGRTDGERRVIINSVGATWEGNQTWLITAAGATFAAWPLVYAVSFSGMYVAMLLVLFALFFRPVGFDYRSKLPDPRWRAAWDWGLFTGSFVPALVFGVAFGNLLLGVPFHFDASMRSYYTGSFWALLNPFALLAGVISVSMLVLHGSVYLQIRTTGAVNARAVRATLWSAAVLIASFGAAGWLVARGIDGYRITAMPAAGLASTPLAKTVTVGQGAWLANYARPPVDDGRTDCHVRRRDPGGGVRARRLAQGRLRRQRDRGGRRHPHGGVRDVSVHPAVVEPSGPQPDRMGCRLEPPDAADHVLGRARLRPADHGVYRVGVRRAARQDHGRDDRIGR